MGGTSRFEKQFPEVGHTVKDSELVEIDVDEMKFSVEDEILIMSRKQEVKNEENNKRICRFRRK